MNNKEIVEVKNTDELKNIILKTKLNDASKVLEENKMSMISDDNVFTEFIKDIIKRNGLTQREVFYDADIDEKYGYKIISGECKVRERDIILKICYASKCTLKETDKVLKLYKMPTLYSKNIRDALLMIAFNEHNGDLVDVNEFLVSHGVEGILKNV